MNIKLTLGSASPRRKDLLSRLGYPVVVLAPDFEEKKKESETPEDYVLRNALGKGESLLSFWCAQKTHPLEFLICADTVVVLDGETLEKPTDKAHAKEMLSKLSGRCHKVYTGVAVWEHNENKMFLTRSFRIETNIWFKTLTSSEIDCYVETGEPMDKAGSYGVQEKGAYLVKRIEGSYTSVMGLPLTEVAEIVQRDAV